jgi:phenylpropionate dioxygenase-like ring-hydroxylating dioxygenase large terminal subunit
VAHAKTIAPLFHDNLSTYQTFGMHLRSVLAKKTIDTLQDLPQEQWQIREHANVLYSLLPTASLLVQPDHIAWIDAWPLARDRTQIRIFSLIPKAKTPRSEKETAYWATNHRLAANTLCEDFVLSEGIQKGLESQANDVLHFGRFESALEVVHRIIDEKAGNA